MSQGVFRPRVPQVQCPGGCQNPLVIISAREKSYIPRSRMSFDRELTTFCCETDLKVRKFSLARKLPSKLKFHLQEEQLLLFS